MPTSRNWLISALVLGTLVLASASAVEAQGNSNPGTIKIHDDLVTDPPQRNEPHVSCDFWVEGFNMEGATGFLVFYEWPPTGDMSEIDSGENQDWVGTPEEDQSGNFHFLLGPFDLPAGHYRVEAYSNTRDGEHFEKAKMFWVDECDGEVERPECPPTTLTAVPQENGDIHVTVSSEDEDAVFNLYRAEEGEDFEYVATLEEGETYVDTDTTIGATYDYAVTVFDEETETESDEFCARASATAIPFFTTVTAGAAAAVAGLAAYVGLRRRKA